MTEDATLRRVAHDVGKYLARTARNLGPGAMPPALRAMLVVDLYGAPNETRPSARLDALAPRGDDPGLERARDRLRAIDALEAAVRRGDEAAIARACALAIEVDELLRARLVGGSR